MLITLLIIYIIFGLIMLAICIKKNDKIRYDFENFTAVTCVMFMIMTVPVFFFRLLSLSKDLTKDVIKIIIRKRKR